MGNSNKAIDDFMSWLEMMIEEYTMDDGVEDLPSHELHMVEGMGRAFVMVENKAKKLGFITPKIRGGSL